jgi:hypothetical protein
MVFKHPQRQDDGQTAVNGRANPVRQHQLVTHEASSVVARYSNRLPLSASNRWTASKFGDRGRLSPG